MRYLSILLVIVFNINLMYAAPSSVVNAVNEKETKPVLNFHDGFADLVEPLIPAVVNIASTPKINNRKAEGRGMRSFGPFPSPFEDFFDFFQQFGFPEGFPPEEDWGRKVASLGSGFIISQDGYVVTNNHLISDSENITVILNDETELEAKVIGMDEKTDLALLKVTYDKPLPYVVFGDSDKSRIGDWVIAIGNPFGLGGTVTAGIISGTSRDIKSGPFDNFLQTDAAINKGNSGGPMFNIDGKVIGINTAIISPSGGNIGIGLAIPSSTAQPVIEQLRKSGHIIRGYLGVQMQEFTKEMAESIGFKGKGVMVANVTPNSPAEKAGIKSNDIITKFNGVEITSSRKLPKLVADTPIDTKVVIEYYRQGKLNITSAVIKEMPKQLEEEVGVTEQTKYEDMIGLKVADLSDNLRSQYGISDDIKGVVVVAVQRRSMAHHYIERGDIITGVNQHNIVDSKGFNTELLAAITSGRKNVLLSIKSGNNSMVITLPLHYENKDNMEEKSKK